MPSGKIRKNLELKPIVRKFVKILYLKNSFFIILLSYCQTSKMNYIKIYFRKLHQKIFKIFSSSGILNKNNWNIGDFFLQNLSM